MSEDVSKYGTNLDILNSSSNYFNKEITNPSTPVKNG